MANTTLPLYEPLGQDKLKRQSKYIESPYDAARVAEVERHKQTEAKVKAIHGDDAKPFISEFLFQIHDFLSDLCKLVCMHSLL